MPGKRPSEPIAPATIPGQRTDPKIPPDKLPEDDEERDEREESDDEREARQSEMAFERAITGLSGR
jgi:hypothetical protein